MYYITIKVLKALYNVKIQYIDLYHDIIKVLDVLYHFKG